MRVFVAGSTGAVGRALVPHLLELGHEVVGLARDSAKAAALEATGARAVVADPFDKSALTEAVRAARPEAVIHQLTSIAGTGNFRKLDEEFAVTNRFRTETTDVLLAAARSGGARRFIAQSFCGWTFAREGGPVKTEDDPLDPAPPTSFRRTLAAIRHLEDAVREAEGIEAIALRYGMFYGPGTAIARDGLVVDLVRKRKLPVVGDGGGVWSFIHVTDVARATAASLTRGPAGIYNVVDDEPATVATWLPELAAAVGARPPRRVPAWLGRLALGEGGFSMMTRVRGASNARAKRELAWQPTYPSWRMGFREGLA